MASFQDFKDKALVAVVTFAIGMMWYDIREMRTDVKLLLEQSASSKVKIENLERATFGKTAYEEPFPPSDHNRKPLKNEMVAVIREENLTPIEDETFDRRT